jgi:hypothetical protein
LLLVLTVNEVLVDPAAVVVVVFVVAAVVLGSAPPGPARYQLAMGSPRHSPTVTALYPFLVRDASM